MATVESTTVTTVGCGGGAGVRGSGGVDRFRWMSRRQRRCRLRRRRQAVIGEAAAEVMPVEAEAEETRGGERARGDAALMVEDAERARGEEMRRCVVGDARDALGGRIDLLC
jgi:hypothetical protein